MRALLGLVLVAFLGWSGWWWVASGAARTGTETALDVLRAEGWQAGYADLTVAGYPNRIDLTATAPRLTPPGAAWGWSAPFVQVFALSYKPWHVIAAFAPEQDLTTPAGPMRLQADRLQSSVVVEPGTDLVLDRFQLAGEALTLTGALAASAETLSLATRPTVGDRLAHDIGLALTGLRPDAAVLALLPAALRDTGGADMRVDASAAFDAPLDRHAATRPPRLTRLDLREALVGWGGVKAHLSGELAPDAQGLAEGRLTLRLEGAPLALEAAVALGLIPPQARAQYDNVLRMLAPGGGPLDLPLRLGGGMVMLGPLPLGPAPRLVP
jgi:hypothetical protein